ncbi:MAG: RNA polymerase sigma factor [Nocardioides sp.]
MKPDHRVRSIGSDPAALEAFYREHVDRIQGYVARRVSDPHLVADLTADIFVAAVEGAEGYRSSRGSAVGWLYGIARNVVADEARSRARELRAVSRISGRRLLGPDSVQRIEERIDAERGLSTMYDGLAALSAADRALIELVALDGLTVAEAAQVLGVKPATARVRLHRSRHLVQHHRPADRPSILTEEIVK